MRITFCLCEQGGWGGRSMAKLVMLRGNSGSGKSSVAKALQKKFGHNTMLISQDVIRRETLWVHDGVGTLALPLMVNLLQYGKGHCGVVILEGILRADWYQELFECALREFHNHIFAYYYDLPFEETLLRHQTKPKRFEFGEEEMRRWWNEKDYIGFIPEKTLTEQVGLEEAVGLIYDDVMRGV